LDDTERGDQGFGSSNTTMDQRLKGQKVKAKVEINEISARAFRQFYRRGETPGILRWDEVDNEIQLEAINISTELAIKNKKNNEDQDVRDMVPREYHHLIDVFEKGEKTTVPPHRPGIYLGIDLEDGKTLPIKKIYALSYDQLEELHRYIKQNEDRGWIRRVKSGRASPIMFVKKKDGKLRLCADYRALNEVTKKDRHPLPLIREALDRLGGAKYFTKLDIKDAYHNVRLREGDQWKTTFSTNLGTYEYLVMPFGLCNAPAAFQRWINEVLMEHIDMCCIVYLDYLLIYSNSLQQHRKDVSNILKAIRKSGMKVKPSKCEFHQSETEYLGFIIGQEGVKTDPVKTQAIWDWTTPKKIKEIQCFLEFCNFYKQFIEGFSRTARPLYARTKKECIGNWEWGDKEQQAFDESRTKLTTAPVLVYFDLLAPTKIETDDSKYVCSCILSQQCQDGKWRPVAYRSKTMSDAECNYDIHDKELLAILQAFHEWTRYTRGNPKPIRVLPDHKNLVTFMTTKKINERHARWMQELSQYNFKIEYRPGKEGGKPDALTRREGDLPTVGDKRLTRNVGILLPKERYWDIPDTEEIKLDMVETTEFRDKNAREIQKASNDDAEIQDVKRNLDEGRKEMKGVALGLCQWKDGLLWYQEKIWIPNNEGIRTAFIAKHHQPPQPGHGGTA